MLDFVGYGSAVRSSGRSQGFWIQQPSPDPSPTSASSGLFVFTGSAAITVSAGDSVLVSGTVSDSYPLASGEVLATTSSLSITEISPVTSVVTLSTGNALPLPTVLTPTTVPGTFSPTVVRVQPGRPGHHDGRRAPHRRHRRGRTANSTRVLILRRR